MPRPIRDHAQTQTRRPCPAPRGDHAQTHTRRPCPDPNEETMPRPKRGDHAQTQTRRQCPITNKETLPNYKQVDLVQSLTRRPSPITSKETMLNSLPRYENFNCSQVEPPISSSLKALDSSLTLPLITKLPNVPNYSAMMSE